MTDTAQRLRPTPAQPTRAERRAARNRRRFARRQWRRRWLVWRYLLAAVLVLALVSGSIWAVYFSSLFAVQRVEVRGTSTLSVEAVERAAAVPLGRPLATTDLRAVQMRVGSLALVRGVEVTRHWPRTVVVEVVERTPVALVGLGNDVRGLDAEGTMLDPVRGSPPDLPRVETSRGVSASALAEAAHVLDALPDRLAARVDHVEVETVDRITLELADGRLVRWGSAEASDRKAAVLAALLRQPRAAEYDVSVPALPTTRG